MTTSCASQRRAALSATASKTGWVSVGELLMTLQNLGGGGLLLEGLGDLALRACSSLNSRTFSIAITAWAANVSGVQSVYP